MEIKQEDKRLVEIETDVEQSFLWYPEFEGKSVRISGGKGVIYYSSTEQEKKEDIIFEGSLQDVGNNCYRLSFNSVGWDIGLYLLVLVGKYVDDSQVEHEIRKSVSFELTGVDRLNYLCWRLQNRLMDYPDFYILDRDKSGNSARYWSYQNYYGFLKDSTSRFNESPRYITSFTIDNLPAEGLLLDGAQAFALFARGRIEKANTFSASDVPQIDRSGYYRDEGGRILNDFDERVCHWKNINRVNTLWVRKQKLPYFAMRYLSFVPSFKNIF